MLKKLLLPAIVIAMLCSQAYILYVLQSKKDVLYVDTFKLYYGFKYKIELEKEVKKVRQERQPLIDSLRFKINLLSRQLQNKQIQASSLRDQYTQSLRELKYKESAFDEDYQRLNDEFNKKIWAQL